MHQEIKYVKWIKCWGCTFPIVVQVGDAIPLGTMVKCPRCGRERPMGRESVMRPYEIPEKWKKETMKSIGLEERDS